MEFSPLFPLRVVCILLLIATLITGVRAYPKLFGTPDAENSGQRLYNKVQIISVWLFCVILFGLMSVIL